MNNNDNKNEVHITQINSHEGFTKEEKKAIIQYEMEENLSKTQQFTFLNNRKNEEIFELPKKKPSLSDTIKLKLSDLRKEIEKENINIELPQKKKSLYDTIIIKLDNLVNKKNAIKMIESKKITSIEEKNITKKKQKKNNNLKKIEKMKLNVDSEEFGHQLYNLNKIALNNLSNKSETKTRRYNSLNKLTKIDKVQISDENYNKYQNKLNRFAINKLYYKIAPKETKKYKIYKYSVILTSFLFCLTLVVILNWIIQGVNIKMISYSITEQTTMSDSYNGTLYNSITPKNISEDMYWRYINTPLTSVEFDNLKKINNDTVAWLIVNNTNVNYPVVQTTNNDYYLNHAFDKSNNNAGWVFADFRDSFNPLTQNTVIYAHGRKDKVMFGSLIDTLDEKWYTDVNNQIIQLSTPKMDTMWQIFSIYKIEAETYYITTSFSSNDSYNNFLSVMKSRSIYDFNIDVNEKDKILTLSTCYNDNGMRLVIQAKLIKTQERTS